MASEPNLQVKCEALDKMLAAMRDADPSQLMTEAASLPTQPPEDTLASEHRPQWLSCQLFVASRLFNAFMLAGFCATVAAEDG